MDVKLENIDGRIYLIGKTFDYKESIKEIGGRWDKDAKGWKIDPSRQTDATNLMNFINGQSGGKQYPLGAKSNEFEDSLSDEETLLGRPAPGEVEPSKWIRGLNTVVRGKANYKGVQYFWTYKGENKNGDPSMKLVSRDGEQIIWRNGDEVNQINVVSTFEKPCSIQHLINMADPAKQKEKPHDFGQDYYRGDEYCENSDGEYRSAF